jgi:opacity protein-like surface antigen
MKSNSFIAATLALIVSCMAASSVLAEPIGSAVRIVNKVTGEIDQRQRDLKTSDAVNQNEAIAVAADSLGELKLNDDTKLALGPGSRMVLDKFVYDPAPSAGTVSVNLLSGAFRFITGLSRKGNYQLRTPSASITVRGTVFDVYVDPAGGTWLLLLEGSVRVCNAANQCADVSNPCGVVHITATGSLDGPQGWPGATRPISFATAFPFVVTPPSIDATPLFTRTAVELNQCGPKKSDVQKAEAPPTPPSPSPSKTPAPQQAYTPPPPSYDNSEPSQPYTPVTPPVITARSFDGAYVGANIGYGFSPSSTNVGCVSPPLNFSFSADCYEAIAAGALATGYDPSPSGVTGGLSAGYDFRFTNVVLGFVTDMSISGMSGRDSTATAVPTFVPEYGSAKESLEWIGTLRSRLGFVADNMLLYVTGGLAYAQVETSYDLSLPAAIPAVSAAASDSGWEAGWTAGVGGEVSFGFFTISAEYLFYDLGTRTLNPVAIRGGIPQPTTYFPTRFDLDGHLFRIGTNFPLN